MDKIGPQGWFHQQNRRLVPQNFYVDDQRIGSVCTIVTETIALSLLCTVNHGSSEETIWC